MLLLLALLATSSAGTPPSGPVHLLFRNDTLCETMDANHTCAERAVGKQTRCQMRGRLWCDAFCTDLQMCADVIEFLSGTDAVVATPMYESERDAVRFSPVRTAIEIGNLFYSVGTAAYFEMGTRRAPIVLVHEGDRRPL